MVFDPAKPLEKDKNPVLINYPGSDPGWRPLSLKSMIASRV